MIQKAICLSVCVLTSGIFWQCQQPARPEEQQATQVLPADSTTALWYKKSIIYTLDVEVFQDSNNDGVGDFKGLTSRLGYIDSLGADVIWLAPFQPSPNQDDGYDITDYYTIDPRLGTLRRLQ